MDLVLLRKRSTATGNSLRAVGVYVLRQRMLVSGLAVLSSLVLLWLVGSQVVDVSTARPLSVMPAQPPSWEHPLGTDIQGRNLFAAVVSGLPLTMRVGFLAGAIGLGIGIILGFAAGYIGGAVDAVIRTVSDVLNTIPTLLVLVVVASSIKGVMSVDMMALVIASLAWTGPTRVIRSQVLTLRERAYVAVSKVSGMNDFEIMGKELLPNMLPFLAASFVNAVIIAVLASVGLEALGLGPQDQPTMGMTIYWAINFGALVAGMWWWWLPPLVAIVVLFIGLYLTATGLDRIANPRIGSTI